MQGKRDPNRELLDAAALCGHLVPAGSVHAFLAGHRGRLFPDELFADLFSGQGRKPPPNADAIAPRWSVEDMNYLSPAEEAECPECGLLAIGGLTFSLSGEWVAFGQHYYEGGNWGFIERATGRYETSGDAGGDVFWRTDNEVVTIGAFYGEEAELRTATLDRLPASRVVPVGPAKRRELRGALSPAGDRVAVVFDEPSDDPSTRRRLGVLPLDGGDLSPVDPHGEKLSVGFTGDGTVVWVEREGVSGILVRPGAEPTPLPDDLYSFSGISPLGPDEIGLAGARRPACREVRSPCEGPTPPFERRYLVVDVRSGDVVWESPGFDGKTGFAGRRRRHLPQHRRRADVVGVQESGRDPRAGPLPDTAPRLDSGLVGTRSVGRTPRDLRWRTPGRSAPSSRPTARPPTISGSVCRSSTALVACCPSPSATRGLPSTPPPTPADAGVWSRRSLFPAAPRQESPLPPLASGG